MKKICMGLLIALLLGLCACGKSADSPTENFAGTTTEITEIAVTTEEPTTEELATLDPNRPIAIMEPLQGGPMLYTFMGKNGKLGLINQDGGLVAEPQYEPPNTGDYSAAYSLRAEYTRDANGRIDGITLQKGEKGEAFIHYTLDGKSRPVKGIPDVGGRYALLDGGLYDVEKDRWKLAPKEGQNITETYRDRVFLQQAEANGTTKLYVYVLEDERIQELPEGVHAYLAELGLYRAGYAQGSPQGDKYYFKYYDQNLKHLPEFSDYRIGLFGGRKYQMVGKNDAESSLLIDQNGKIQESPYLYMRDFGKCWLGSNEAFAEPDANVPKTLLDDDLKPIYKAQRNEKIIPLYPVPYEHRLVGLIAQDAGGNIVKAFDANGKPMQTKDETQFFMDQFLFGGTLYKLKDSKWTALDLRQFLKPDVEDYCAVAMVVTEDWVIVATSFFESRDEVFAIDWTGKQYNNCPLMPFVTLERYLYGAGEQGPNYYWVEQGGKRGYVNTKGEWLFVEQ